MKIINSLVPEETCSEKENKHVIRIQNQIN